MRSRFKRALVTGGAGFIGSHIVDRLVQDGVKVTVIDNLSSGRLENLSKPLDVERIEFVKGDVRNMKTVDQVVKDIDVVFHEAALVGVQPSMKNPVLTNDVNVGGTVNLLQASVKHGVKRFVLASSASVYGDQDSVPVKEDMVPNPSSPMAASKLSAECYLEVFHRTFGLETVALRYFNVYGERQAAGGSYSAVIIAFLRCLMTGVRPIIYGDGDQTRDFIHVDDVVEANMLTMEKDRVNLSFNIATGVPVKINELFALLRDLTGKHEVQPKYFSSRKAGIRESWADTSRAKRILGFQAKVPFEEGLSRLVDQWNC
jgi:nucleoside-diphosphate-sugar epimerase